MTAIELFKIALLEERIRQMSQNLVDLQIAITKLAAQVPIETQKKADLAAKVGGDGELDKQLPAMTQQVTEILTELAAH